MSAAFAAMPTKEQAACCMAKRDALGRPPIGFCGDDCARRSARDLLIEYRRRVRHVMSEPRDWSMTRMQETGWEPWSDEWDDPTADAVLAVVR